MGFPIEIRTNSEFNESEKKFVTLSKLDKSLMEAWCATGTNTQLSYATHGIFRYFGKFPPTIATQLINDYTTSEDTVYDLMSGSGTTGVECMFLERDCVLNDINPLSILLAKVKTTKLDCETIEGLFAEIKTRYRPLSIVEFNFQPQGIKNLDHWFLSETQDSLRGILKLINEIKDESYRNFFMVCFLSTVRPVSKATTQQGRLFLDVMTAQLDAFETFEKKYTTAKKGVLRLPEKKSKLEIISVDLRIELPQTYKNRASLIILHPPYFNSYKYSSINSLELAWLKCDHAVVRKDEIREFFKIGKAENVKKYIDDMTQIVANVAEVVRDNGHIAIMIGDTVIKNEYISVTDLLLNEISKRKLAVRLEKIILRVPKYTEASWAASQRRNANSVGVKLNDFILILRKVQNA